MKHLILVIAVLAGSAQAQQQPKSCLELKKVKVAHHVLRQHGQTQAELTLKVKNCEIVEQRQQTTVTFESKPGLDVTLQSVAFRHFDESAPGHSATEIREVVLFLDLAASTEFPVGESTVHGMLTYQALDGGSAVPRNVALNFLLKVAPLPPGKPIKKHSAFVNGLERIGWFFVIIFICPFTDCA